MAWYDRRDELRFLVEKKNWAGGVIAYLLFFLPVSLYHFRHSSG
jgi:hypothetical protein